jgi:CRISPR-associated protein Csb1
MTSASLEPKALLKSDAQRLVLQAKLRPVGGLDRFQPAGFPEIGHVIYDAPRSGSVAEKVCILDSAASMANHLEVICLRGQHDPSLVAELDGLPYLRCVTGSDPKNPEIVVTSFTEGHRLASTYFLDGFRVMAGSLAGRTFGDELREGFGFRDLGKKSHPLPKDWWTVYKTIFAYDPNSLVHGILLPQWQIKIPRILTAVHEAFGALRVATSGVKFDKLGKTTSGQPIFAKDEETATEIRATFILDLGLLRSFGRVEKGDLIGLSDLQKELLLALSLWKLDALLRSPFRYRSGCDLECIEMVRVLGPEKTAAIERGALALSMPTYIKAAAFTAGVTDVYWQEDKLFKEALAKPKADTAGAGDEDEEDGASED